MGDRLIRVRRQEQRNVYIHNDLDSAAFYFNDRIRKRVAEDDRDGIGYDCMALATMCAFTWEAYLNFYGFKLLKAFWNERWPLHRKIHHVFQKLKIKPDWSTKPYLSIRNLTTVRNILAHGKPVEETIDKIEEGSQSEVDRHRIDLSGKWQEFCTTDAVLQQYEDLQKVWNEMFKASGLGPFDTMTHGQGGVEYIEDVETTEVITKKRAYAEGLSKPAPTRQTE